MDNNEQDVEKTVTEKLEGICKYLTKYGFDAKEAIKFLIEEVPQLSEWLRSVIDTVWRSIKELESKDAKSLFIQCIHILSRMISQSRSAIILIGLLAVTRFVYIIVVYFLKIAFKLTDIKESLTPKLPKDDAFVHELAGLAERLVGTETFINGVDVQDHIDEFTLQSLSSQVDINIAVEQLGKLKSRIMTLMNGGQEQLLKCLHFLTLFVRISTLRNSLLFRFMACLSLKNYGHGTVTILENIIEKERLNNRSFLSFFSQPSLKNAAVFTVFDPSEENVKELVTYMKELGIPLQDLKEDLHGQTFLMKPFTKPEIFLGRPFLSLSSVRAIKESETDTDNVRIRFTFTAVDRGFNLFYIQSPELGEYMYMKENTYCKYKEMSAVQENAIWRVICVGETGVKDDIQSYFMFCTKRWPEKIIFMEDTYFECAKGREDFATISQNCLFTLIPPGYLPIKIQNSSENLTELQQNTREREALQTQNQTYPEFADDIPVLQSIHIFLDKHGIQVERELEQIGKYLLKSEDDNLQVVIKKIAECLADLDEDELNDHVMQGLLKIISINFQLFQNGFFYGSILRELLRVCGLIGSCVWQVKKIEEFVCSNIEKRLKATVAKDVRELKRFALFLRGIERGDNIQERDIRDIRTYGKFCEELPSHTSLKERGKSEYLIMFTCAKVSILQLSILWQMYAVAKLPGHSEHMANYLREIILSQKNDDLQFYDCNVFPGATHEMVLVKKYLICLGIGAQDSKSTDLIKLSPQRRKLGLLRLVVVPLLEEFMGRHLAKFVLERPQE